MKYIGDNDPKEYKKIVEFSEKELSLFDKCNPTLFSICMYISRSGVVPGKFKTLDHRRLIIKPEDLTNGCTYETDVRAVFPVMMFFGDKIQDTICRDCSCRLWHDGMEICCLERTWKEATCNQEMVDYTDLPIYERIQRLKDSIKIHQGIKVV